MVILFSLISLSFIFSLPSYAIEENSGCINCHVNPTGGVMRNDYGSNIYSLDELSIRKWIKDKKFDGYISDNIQIGGEFRVQSYAGQNKSNIFPMQFDIHSNIEFNNDISMFMKYGADPEFYILLDDLLRNDWIKIGRTISVAELKVAKAMFPVEYVPTAVLAFPSKPYATLPASIKRIMFLSILAGVFSLW